MGTLFERILHKYINIIDGFDKGMKVISGYEKKNKSGDTYRDNLMLAISRLEAFRDKDVYKRQAVNRRVVGSNPTRGAFKKIWPDGQAVKTRPFHGCNPGSIPGRVIYAEDVYKRQGSWKHPKSVTQP